MLSSFIRARSFSCEPSDCDLCETSRLSFLGSIRHLPFWSTPGASAAALKAALAADCNPSVSTPALFLVLPAHFL
jgi:hypothetical protein